jgi:hypothetical protein
MKNAIDIKTKQLKSSIKGGGGGGAEWPNLHTTVSKLSTSSIMTLINQS